MEFGSLGTLVKCVWEVDYDKLKCLNNALKYIFLATITLQLLELGFYNCSQLNHPIL